MKTLTFLLVSVSLLSGLVLFSRTQNASLLWTKTLKFLGSLRPDWWIKVTTDSPLCTYYFGPFDSVQEAANCQTGYLEDLQDEGALGISAKILRIQPQTLTQEGTY